MPSHVMESAPNIARHGAARSRLRENLQNSLGDAGSFGVMVGIGESYLSAFVLALGLGDLLAGMIASVPLLAGGLMQMASPAAVQRLGSHKRWVVICAGVQAVSFVPLLIGALSGRLPAWAVLLVASIYWGSGQATGPAWNTWAGTLVPPRIRAHFFARRTKLSQAAVLTGFLIGGACLQGGVTWDQPLWGFAACFAVAGVCRMVSVYFLARQSEPVPIPPNMKRLSVPQVYRRLRSGPVGALLLYIVAVQGAAQFAGPFFAPFMLRELQLDYVSFVALLSAAFVAKVLALPVFGRLAHRCGAVRLLWIGGVAICPVSAGWLVSDSLPYLIALQFVAGIVWAAYELAIFLLFFEAIPEEERTSILTVYNLANGLSFVGGSLLGAAYLAGMGITYETYHQIFLISTLLRLLTLLLLRRVPDLAVRAQMVPMRTVAVRPSAGTVDAPIVAGMDDRANDANDDGGIIEVRTDPAIIVEK